MSHLESNELECIVTETGPDPSCSVIWLHGLGADGHDFEPIVPQLRQATAGRSVRFVFPHAPVRPVTVNGGMAMRAWYDILGFDIARDQDVEGIADSQARVQRLIDREIEGGVPAARIVLAGFSQGGAIALRCGLAQRETLAGVIALSCYLLDGDGLSRWSTEAGRRAPVFMGHGSVDPIVPMALGRHAAEALAAADVEVQWQAWVMQHGVHPDEITAIDRWLDARWRAER
ncbi:alpha/beta fold hydrolase [Wenzhouxiangella sp. XN79A]|uniref:alpha/beta hydrolase n=1 Tax=Wenzhouxiangella sp. XN79A TaxID=2724193 RepID=UPI00144AEE2B|nr:alpha/beta fold hydrolase [Wenzhouxiangella sp. XN79A]NKI35799.1 alpha/beta fold hydrolase [Wenzhouxiangella sp. XN79A]